MPTRRRASRGTPAVPAASGGGAPTCRGSGRVGNSQPGRGGGDDDDRAMLLEVAKMKRTAAEKTDADRENMAGAEAGDDRPGFQIFRSRILAPGQKI
mmetsp:Transcript_31104/g.61602  ORF Transcript_31104/g.61602 Transcript_31104/m.61602 type:complete len:97 (+) Transcript_31104:2328-2618(+)